MVKEQNRLYSLLSFLLILGLFLTVNLRANASTTYQESEPNDTQQNANQLINGQYTFGKISSDGDKDWYVLSVLSPGDIRATLEDLPADYDLYLYD
ncbi:hypothetical protein J6TS2_14810 [Heyndrickxia sporothermodurans]|nr:hypothetical protein J6TS2_14810 [Heyndrickxia sporothermodurans]